MKSASLVALLACVLFAIVGCGGGGSSSGSTGSTGVTTVTTTTTTTIPAATSSVYPAFVPPFPQILIYSRNPTVINNPILIPVFFPGTPDQAATVAYLQKLATSSSWAVLQQYGVQSATVGTPIIVSSNPPATLTMTDVANFVTANDGTWTASPTGSEIYILYYPPSSTITDDAGQNSYHAWTAQASPVQYAVIPQYSSVAVDAYVQFHEAAEAASDPGSSGSSNGYLFPSMDYTGWSYLTQTELADACVYTDFYLSSTLGQTIKSMWSNSNLAAGLAPCYEPPTSVQMFGAFPVLTATQANKYTSINPLATNIDHIITIAPGGSATVPVKLFSYGPLGGPISLTVSQTNLSSDKSNAATFKFDKSTGTNGDTVNLTISTPQAAYSAAMPYVTFAIYSQMTDAQGTHYGYPFPGMAISNSGLLPGGITTVAGDFAAGYFGDNGLATSAELNSPGGVAVDGSGNVYIADSKNYRIRKVSTTGIISTVAGNGTQGYSGDNGPAINASLNFTVNVTSGIAVDAKGNIYIADQVNQRIRKVDTNGTITTVAGNGTQGFSGDNGPATSAQLFNPQGVAVDASGNLYIADWTNNRIRKVDNSGRITTVAGNGTWGFSGDGGSAITAQINDPQSVAVDSIGNLYIGDTGNSRVRKVTVAGSISTIAGNGTNTYSGDNGSATSAGTSVAAVAVDSGGNVYIVDNFSNRIRKVSANGVITTVAGGGSSFPGDNGPAINAITFPQGIALDANGNIYIADQQNAIRRVIAQ